MVAHACDLGAEDINPVQSLFDQLPQQLTITQGQRLDDLVSSCPCQSTLTKL